MLILLYITIVNIVIPQLSAYAQALLEPVMVIVITVAGLLMLFGSIGVKISTNLGSTIIGGILNGIFLIAGYIVKSIIRAISWIFTKMIPTVFNGCRRTFTSMGMNSLGSNILAIMVTIVAIVAII